MDKDTNLCNRESLSMYKELIDCFNGKMNNSKTYLNKADDIYNDTDSKGRRKRRLLSDYIKEQSQRKIRKSSGFASEKI